MSDPIELDSGELVEVASGAVVLRMPAARAHSVAHLLDGWASAAGRTAGASSRVLARVLEDGATALGDPDAAACTRRLAGSVPTRHRLAAVGVLGRQQPALSLVQRLAAVDAAARWMDDDAGDELAYALLSAVCSAGTTASRAYLALLTGSE